LITRSVDISKEPRRLDGVAPRLALVAGVVGAVGLGAGVVAGWTSGWTVFFRSYLLNYAFVLSLALGGLFFVMLQHLVRAGWSVSIRRLAEMVAGTMPLLAVLFVPLLIPVIGGMEGVYEWSSAAAVDHDDSGLLAHKQGYLNVPFFIVRCVIYFVVWVLLARLFLRTSLAQDATGDVALTHRMQWWSAPGMLLYAVTVSFFSIDALMSLNPHWFSTIWGVYYFSGSAVGFFALLALLVTFVQRSGRLPHVVTIEHFHDMGKLLFAFVVFWAYIAFSQYMLIWYANIPEETVWFQPRQGDRWWLGVSLLLLFGHFIAPFLALISRVPKRRKQWLVAAAVWMLLMHWLDLYYIVVPPTAGHAAHARMLAATDVLLLVGLAGLFMFSLLRQMGRYSLIPERDPRLNEALTFQNV
jgi:hypothetical protein